MTRLFAALIVLLALAGGTRAAEVINAFDADIQVLSDGTLDITETIRVTAEGDRIRRGIYRDIPMREIGRWGFWVDHGFEVVEVTRDGAPESWRSEWHGRFVRIYLGQEDVILSPGRHTYTIRYRTTGQLRDFEDYDEIYWNVTGNFWIFPILEATATVHLPEGAVATDIAAYTGGYGSDGRDYEAVGEGTDTVRFRATRPLQPQEGLTVAVGFTDGVVAFQHNPTSAMLRDNIGLLLLIAGWAALPIYYLFAWNRVGRDPPARTVIPLFHPPDDLEPAALSYVHFNGFRTSGSKDLTFIAALLSLGVKKKLTIEEESRKAVTLMRTPGAEGVDNPLPAGEAALYEELLGYREDFAMTKANGSKLLSAREAFRQAISRLYGGKYYKLNLLWFVPGVVLGAVTLFAGLFLQAPPDDALLYIIPVIICAAVGAVLIGFARFILADPLTGIIGRIFGIVLMGIGVVMLAVGTLLVLFGDGFEAYRLAGGLLLIGAVTTVLMLYLLGAPTARGAEMLPRIEGFKLYLETAEVNRLNMRDAPEMSEDLFERYLPYAAGLGVEEPWSEAWAAHLRRVAPERADDYHPAWYHGRSWSSGGIGAATAASVAAVSSAMASAMPEPKGSSGSSGGGFSGGGGGGGGGGGW